MSQEDLFTHAAFARRSDPPTSHQAAAAVDSTAKEVEVLRLLVHLGPSTQREVAEEGGDYGGLTPRFRPLLRKDMIRLTGDYRRNVGGRRAAVYEITQAGRGKV